MKEILYILSAVAMISCTQYDSKQQTTDNPSTVVELSATQRIEAAHSKTAFLSNEIVQFDIVLEFGGTERLNGSMILATNSSKGKIVYKDGRELYYDEDLVYADTSFNNHGSARFAAYTWSYFFLFPYKLSDPGTNWSDEEQTTLNGETYNSQKLTFGEGVGDAPDDWYITYSDTETHLMEVAAYIVTAGGSTIEEAEEDPHAISYHDYKDVDGVALAHSWKFWEWRKDSGLTRQLGKARLSGLKFMTEDEFDFSALEGMVKIK
ncbi:DUF6503 family protein [Cryomorphaceae bacterium 1068]|nr:DUF6503 family protein [Cryomorphaceae bacterium 1068]